MADTTRITVTLPTDQVVARQLRHQFLGADLLRHQEEQGSFTVEELAEAHSRIFGTAEAGGPASAT
ncbi:hypothetical protein [Streptomyces griseosporeus]|jgi:hypothetical protein|uniref:hypothetical protein n=1 Tax=Streptomyces griseosporeus TaxID=1910 RepID=UPI003674860C